MRKFETAMENPYNQVPYQSAPFPQAHVSRLATMATLLGVEPPNISSCRVLELGCGEGAHLIPMALEFPESQFVGIDLAERPIAKAIDNAAELGLENISFRVADVLQLSGQPGECDYLIAHGLYSWVPEAVQEKALELCGRLLSRSGVGYVSYNAYPAWHVREMTRNMVRMHTAGLSDPVEIRNRAISLLAGIYRSQSEQEPYREAIRAEMERIIAKDAYLCFHDDFGEDNHPVYFSEFIRRAAAQGLQFLAEAEPPDMQHPDIAPDVREALAAINDAVEREQYYDFVTCRGFRRTLLCHDDLVLDRTIPVERLKNLYFAAAVKCSIPVPDLVTFSPAEFVAQSGASITVTQPFVKVVLFEVSRAYPGSLTFDYLLERARSVAPLLSTADGETMLREVLLRMHLPGIMEMSVVPYRYPAQPAERPVASRLAKMQLKNGGRTTSLRHRTVDIDDELARSLFALLDGTRDPEALRDAVEKVLGRDVSIDEITSGLERLNELALLEA
jgi:methyltransferase-like protein/ubiquinone/menaquinone biosynthesis C-methylase UbiE